MSYLFNFTKLATRLHDVRIRPELYEIGGYGEGCLCIEQRSDGLWETYTGQKGEKDDLMAPRTKARTRCARHRCQEREKP